MEIVKITEENYAQLEDLVFWRQNGRERAPTAQPPSPAVVQALADPDLALYAAREDGRLVGWISLLYQPKVHKWQGRGHIYVDELWVQPEYRRRGVAKALMQLADQMAASRNAHGVRLYVNVENPGAKALYEGCGYHPSGQAYFMEK